MCEYLDVWIIRCLMDNDPWCVAKVLDKYGDVSKWGQWSGYNRAKFEAGRCAAAGRDFEPNKEFEPCDSCFFCGGGSEGDAVPEGKEFLQVIFVDVPGSVAADFVGCR